MDAVHARLADVRERIARAAARAGRDLSRIRLVSVSKTFDAAHVRAAALAGQIDFGENKVQEAQQKQGETPKSSTLMAREQQQGAPKSSTATAAANAKGVSGTVKLAPALATRAAPEDTVFVLARPAQGGRMPLAALRVKVKDLPLVFSFDDSMAMNPSAKISDFTEVVVAARVSKSGNVVPQRGDLEGVSKSLRPGTSGIVVQIANEIQ